MNRIKMKNNKRMGFTIVELIVSFSLTMIVLIYLLRTIIVISNKENELLTLQEYTVVETNLLNSIYKDIKMLNPNEVSILDRNGSILIDGVGYITFDIENNYIIYNDAIYELPEGVEIDSNPYSVKVIEDATLISENTVFYIAKINLIVNNEKRVLKIVHQYFNENVTPVACVYNAGKEWTFEYTGSEQSFTVPCSGNYKVELWGAQGGNDGGKGAYSLGNILLKENQKLYLQIGGEGRSTPAGEATPALGGYNGGGSTTGQDCCNRSFGTGGGATDIRLVSGSWNNFESLKSRIMVAAGGGGRFVDGTSTTIGGAGGTLTGFAGEGDYVDWCLGLGGTQTKGGSISENTGTYCVAGEQVGYTDPGLVTGKFGIGGVHGSEGNASTGGGGGYYGGSSSGHIASAGGGSSFISGYTGCDAISESSTENNIVHTGQSNHYSGLVFTETNMIAGNESMPTHDGLSTITGNTGNGYAKITYLNS